MLTPKMLTLNITESAEVADFIENLLGVKFFRLNSPFDILAELNW
jgi:hypothetical protein